MTLCAAVAAEWILSRRGPREALLTLGLGAPRPRALFRALLLCAALLAFYPIFSLVAGAELRLHPNWPILAIGIVAQAGVAEETVFRGFLFRRFRESRSFWRAALLAAVPFVAVHALLFLTMDFAIALASLLLAVSISFPLAWLFERGGGSIWAPAIVHAVVQGSIKLIVVDEQFFMAMAVAWIAVSGLAPWLLFLLRPQERDGMSQAAASTSARRAPS